MTCGIYLITNTITNKNYIGQSIHIEKRIKQHQYKSDSKTSYIENSIAEYGWENFTWQILYECPPEELDIEERKFISLYNTYHNGYNLTRGGDLKGCGNPMHNPILKQKNLESKKGYKHSDETKYKISFKKNRTGFYGVFKEYDDKLVQGFCYRYDLGKFPIRAIDINKLEIKVKESGLKWCIINQELAEKTVSESEKLKKIREKEHPNGYYRVSKCNSKDYIKGYYYRYAHHENGKVSSVQATTIEKLKEKVLRKGWEWIEF